MRALARPLGPVLVDEVVRNIRIHEREKLRDASQRDCRVHAIADYPFALPVCQPSTDYLNNVTYTLPKYYKHHLITHSKISWQSGTVSLDYP
jgi:hypothetical protein